MNEHDASDGAQRASAAQREAGAARGALKNTIYQRRTVSSRRMTRGRRLLYAIAAPALLGLVRLWWRSCRIVAVVGEEHLLAVLDEVPSFLPCYWHQHHLFMARYLLGAQQRTRLRIGFLISPSVDGELGAMIIRRAGAQAIRGSSSHTGALALKDYFLALTREQISPVINPDGPRGPRFKFKPGALLLAQMSGRPILPMAYAASSAWLLQWDKFVLPRPFARIVIAIGAAQRVPRTLSPEALGDLQRQMEQALKGTFQRARARLQGRDATPGDSTQT